jgi:hypothetical protein
MGVLGYPVVRGIVRDARAGEAGIGCGLACRILDSEDDHFERTLQELYLRIKVFLNSEELPRKIQGQRTLSRPIRPLLPQDLPTAHSSAIFDGIELYLPSPAAVLHQGAAPLELATGRGVEGTGDVASKRFPFPGSSRLGNGNG